MLSRREFCGLLGAAIVAPSALLERPPKVDNPFVVVWLIADQLV